MTEKIVGIVGAFDDLRSKDVRFLQAVANHGQLHVFLVTDDFFYKQQGKQPEFQQEERAYLLDAVRFVDKVHLIDSVPAKDVRLSSGEQVAIWADRLETVNHQEEAIASSANVPAIAFGEDDLPGFDSINFDNSSILATDYQRKKVVVTGCFDWFHSGHVRFFEEASEFGDLYVVVGHDKNVRLLKGGDHPLFGQEERRYMVGSIRFVKKALISTGHGWMDAEPEIAWIEPDIYVVNEDGDRPEKRSFCEERAIDYVVLRRRPKHGLPRRESTRLRGF